jgi:transcriptional regulator with XRE-family HTH domain
MSYSTDDILRTLRAARESSGLSQRDLSSRVGVPQSHISKIESGATDLRLSSLVEMARALDYELVLVPRKLLSAVGAIVSNSSSAGSADARLRSAALNRARAVITRLGHAHPDHPELERLARTLRELARVQLDRPDIDTIRDATERLAKLPRSGSLAMPEVQRVSRQLQELRNRIAHAVPEAPRPAYALDQDDDDA